MKQVQQFLLIFLLFGRRHPLGGLLQTSPTDSKCSKVPDTVCIWGTSVGPVKKERSGCNQFNGLVRTHKFIDCRSFCFPSD